MCRTVACLFLLSMWLSATTAPLLIHPSQAAEPAGKPADRWESSIARFEALDAKHPPPKGAILFIGSSSIVGWDLAKSFPGLPVINRGFGGSHLADSVRYAERIVLPYRPKIIVLYAGDNDLAAGKTPERVWEDYKAFVNKVHAALPQTKIIYIGIKPSIARWHLIDKIRKANRLIAETAATDQRLVFVDIEKPMLGPDGKPRQELLKADGLHLNQTGYKLWSDLLRPHLKDAVPAPER
jgi:lysophospholipase L1-like esterase